MLINLIELELLLLIRIIKNWLKIWKKKIFFIKFLLLNKNYLFITAQ